MLRRLDSPMALRNLFVRFETALRCSRWFPFCAPFHDESISTFSWQFTSKLKLHCCMWRIPSKQRMFCASFFCQTCYGEVITMHVFVHWSIRIFGTFNLLTADIIRMRKRWCRSHKIWKRSAILICIWSLHYAIVHVRRLRCELMMEKYSNWSFSEGALLRNLENLAA